MKQILKCIQLFTTQFRVLTALKMKALENTVGFSAFPTLFSTLSTREIIILAMFNLSSAIAFNLVTSKILSFGEGLNQVC